MGSRDPTTATDDAILTWINQAADYPYRVQTDRGAIQARTVLHATNACARALIPELRGPNGVFGIKGHMLGIRSSEPSARELAPGLLHTYAIHYLLQRPKEAATPGAVFLYGFSDGEVVEDFDDSTTLPATETEADEIRRTMYTFLENALPHHFPSKIDPATRVEYDWTGMLGCTQNGCSIVGRVSPERLGEFLCVAHNGEGMCRCFVLSAVLAQAVLAELDEAAYEVPVWFPRAYARNLGMRK